MFSLIDLDKDIGGGSGYGAPSYGGGGGGGLFDGLGGIFGGISGGMYSVNVIFIIYLILNYEF